MNEKTNKYEALYILRPQLTDAEVSKIADRFKTVITDQGGEVESAGKWDKRRLAYEVQGCKEGTYVLMKFECPTKAPAELNRLLRISDDVIRQIIITVE